MLVVAGSLLRAQEGQVESDVLFRALRDFNIPKILSQDMVIFTGLLQDLFPAVDPPRKRDIEFEKVQGMFRLLPTAGSTVSVSKLPALTCDRSAQFGLILIAVLYSLP